jgi:putative transposase
LKIQKYINEIKNDEIGQYYGYKKVTAMLVKQYKLIISKKKVYRLMNNMALLKLKKKPISRYKRICKNHLISNSNRLWEMDMKYVYIAKTKQVGYLTSIIDVFDRSILACDLSLSANAQQAQNVLIKALYNRSIKGFSDELTVRTDNGSQFISYKFEKLCTDEGITHERIPVRSPNYNAHIESYHRYLQDECLEGRLFSSLEEATEVINHYVRIYNTKRIHSSIDYNSPNEFYNLKKSNFKNNLVISL